ncbi:hypothetical protein Tco_1370725 [Tanacetum coccineum]
MVDLCICQTIITGCLIMEKTEEKYLDFHQIFGSFMNLSLINFASPFKVPQFGGSPNKVGDEAINEEMLDSVERVATTATSLEAEIDGGYNRQLLCSFDDDLDEEDASKQGRKSDKTKPMFKDSDFDGLDDDMENVEGEIVYVYFWVLVMPGTLVNTARPTVSTAGPSTSAAGTSTSILEYEMTITPPHSTSDTRGTRVKGRVGSVYWNQEELAQVEWRQRERATQEEATIAALYEEYDTIQHSIDVDAFCSKMKKRLWGTLSCKFLRFLSAKYPIADWESQNLGNFDRQDLVDLHKLVMKRFEDNTPEGYNLLLWGDLKMLNWKLEAEAESTMAFELLKFIKSQGELLGIMKFYKLVLLVQLDTAGDG